MVVKFTRLKNSKWTYTCNITNLNTKLYIMWRHRWDSLLCVINARYSILFYVTQKSVQISPTEKYEIVVSHIALASIYE